VRGARVVDLHRGTTSLDSGVAVTESSLFDLASLTKAFVAVAALSVWEDGLVDLDAPVAEVLPVGTGAGAGRVTLRLLLTHTAGLPPTSSLWREEGDPGPLLERVLATPLDTEPGSQHAYSCLGYIAAGRVLEIVTAAPLDALVRRRVLDPLGAGSARFGPVATTTAVATEAQPGRGVVHGTVHDELAHALGRPVGNAGLFGTADDVLALGELLLGTGEGRAGRVLGPDAMALLRSPSTVGSAGSAPYAQAVGFRIADPGFMGSVPGIGHTGFTGTSLVANPARGTVTVLLTNRVHPTRVGTDVGPLRRALAEAVRESRRTPPR
jgi:CubicO group peptidase (beta-lactamase class C family)